MHVPPHSPHHRRHSRHPPAGSLVAATLSGHCSSEPAQITFAARRALSRRRAIAETPIWIGALLATAHVHGCWDRHCSARRSLRMPPRFTQCKMALSPQFASRTARSPRQIGLLHCWIKELEYGFSTASSVYPWSS